MRAVYVLYVLLLVNIYEMTKNKVYIYVVFNILMCLIDKLQSGNMHSHICYFHYLHKPKRETPKITLK